MKLLKKSIISLFLFCLAILNSCSSVTGNGAPSNASKTFLDNKLTMQANLDYAAPDTIITISMECFPFYAGKGRIVLQVVVDDKLVSVLTPVRDTIGSTRPSNASENKVSFEQRSALLQEWKIKLIDLPGSYAFEGYAYMDSIFVDGVLVAIDSKAARAAAPFGNHFQNIATTPEHLFLPAKQ